MNELRFNRLQKFFLGADNVKQLQAAQDAKLATPQTWASSTGLGKDYLPFTQPSDVDIELLYLYSSMGRIACEIIPKDSLRRWFTFVKDKKENDIPSEEDKEGETESEEEASKTTDETKDLLAGDVADEDAADYDEKFQEQLRNIRTPQNPNWGYRELKKQAMIWENLYGWACIAFVPTSADQIDQPIEAIEGNRGDELDWIVFSKPHVTEETFDVSQRIFDNIPQSLVPDAWEIELKSSLGWSFSKVIPRKNCIIYNFRAKIEGWEGQPIMYPIFGPLVFLENILFGNTNAVWSQGMGNFVLEWPTATDLESLNVNFGSLGNKQMTHLHKSDKNLSERIYNASLSGTIYNPKDLLDRCVDLVCGYLQVPPAVLFGTPQGALSSSWVQDINYETTLMSNQEEITPQTKIFLDWALGYTGEIAWNTGEIIDEGMRADARIKQLQYHTINEVRAKDDLPPLPGGDVLLSEFNSKNIGMSFTAKGFGDNPDDPDNKARKNKSGEEAGTPEKERPDGEKGDGK